MPLAQLEEDPLGCSLGGGLMGRIGSDQSFMTGICRLEAWVTVPDPTSGQKLELDPSGQMGDGQGQPFPVTGL